MFGWSKSPTNVEDLAIVADEGEFDLNDDLEMMGDVGDDSGSIEGSSSQEKLGLK